MKNILFTQRKFFLFLYLLGVYFTVYFFYIHYYHMLTGEIAAIPGTTPFSRLFWVSSIERWKSFFLESWFRTFIIKFLVYSYYIWQKQKKSLWDLKKELVILFFVTALVNLVTFPLLWILIDKPVIIPFPQNVVPFVIGVVVAVSCLEAALIAMFYRELFTKKNWEWIIVCLVAFVVSFYFNGRVMPGKHGIPSRVNRTFRQVDVRLESYYNEHNRYPEILETVLPSDYRRRDLYDPHKRSFCYYIKEDFWVLVSRGPEGRLRLYPGDFERIVNRYSDDPEALKEAFSEYLYDPTNGTMSRGDVMRSRDALISN